MILPRRGSFASDMGTPAAAITRFPSLLATN
jgi:hypothetical protein